MSCFLIVPLQITGAIGRNFYNLFCPKLNLFIQLLVLIDAICCPIFLDLPAEKEKDPYDKTVIPIFRIKMEIQS